MAIKKIQLVGSLIRQAENADTLDGKHADEFATKEYVDEALENIEIPEAGVTSWNDLTDKPFGAEVTESVIEWDGNSTGKEILDIGIDSVLVKISDDVLTVDELIGSTVVINTEGTESSISIDQEAAQALQMMDGVLAVMWNGSPIIFIVTADGDYSGLLMKKGTYFCVVEDDYYNPPQILEYVKSLSCLTGQVETIKKLDENYIPNTIARTTDIPTIEEIIAELPIYNGEVIEI